MLQHHLHDVDYAAVAVQRAREAVYLFCFCFLVNAENGEKRAANKTISQRENTPNIKQ